MHANDDDRRADTMTRDEQACEPERACMWPVHVYVFNNYLPPGTGVRVLSGTQTGCAKVKCITAFL